ncbi:hypothetical protein H0H87_003952 [Tephrocybe sp. NHM501043]|nr:hypothetical protein H0H87_003952 [Tephrocybe sp. NHM501043]
MPASTTRESRPSAKRPRLEQARVFTSVEDISSALRTQNQETLLKDLTALRNQFSIRPGEDTISPSDPRLLLAQHWLEHVPGAHDIFNIWDTLSQRQNSLFALIVSVLSSLVTLTSSHYTFQALGHPIIKSLLTPTYTRRLNSYLGGTHAELILVTLKLYNALSTFAGGREKKAVLEAFGWELKSLPKLLNMRRKSAPDTSDALSKPDIRTLYILFILSFFTPDTPTQVKATFIEQHRDAFLSIFKGLVQDSYNVVRKILEVCWVGLWADPKIKRTTKINLFNETTVSHLLKLYDRTLTESESDADHIPADLVHHFLLAICTRPGTGICFKDRGWYPRESDANIDDEPVKGRGRIYNRILSNVLKTLKVNEDLRQQELALKIMSACPELVAGYWSNAALTLEPRLSSKWIANISFFGSVLSLPVPSSSFYLNLTSAIPTTSFPSLHPSGMYNPTPPPLSTIIENVFPSVSTKALFTKGFSTSAGLVQHCTAVALCKCLAKYEAVVDRFREVEEKLGEGEDGQWGRRRREVEREIRKRVPDFMVIVAFSQATTPSTTATPNSNPDTKPTNNPTRAALLAESAQNLLQHILASSILFQDDHSEPHLWLISLPTSWRGQGTESPDGASLTNEAKSVIVFLDDCLQRCIKTPYRYLEDLHVFDQPAGAPQLNQSSTERDEPLPSPLLMTVLEQLEIKVVKKILSPSDVLALATFTRKLIFRLASKQQEEEMTFLRKVAERIDKILGSEKLFATEFPVITGAIRQEVGLLLSSVLPHGSLQSNLVAVKESSNDVKIFLSTIEKMPVPSSLEERRSAAQELVDWLRLLETPIGPAEIARVASLLTRLYPPSMVFVSEHVSPATEALWDGLDVSARYPELQQHLTFDFLFLHATQVHLADPTCREILADAALGHEPTLGEVKRAICLIGHKLASHAFEAKENLFFLLASILKRASKTLSSNDLVTLKVALFVQCHVIKAYLKSSMLGSVLREACHQMVHDSLDPRNVQDRELLADTCSHWLEALISDVDDIHISLASPWIQYLQREQIFRLLDSLFLDVLSTSESATMPSPMFALLGNVLTVMRRWTTTQSGFGQELIQRLPKLITLYTQAPSAILEDLVAVTVQSSLPAYYDGSPCAENLEEKNIGDLAMQAELRWSRRLDRWSATIPVQNFLLQALWSGSTVTIISGLMYQGHVPMGIVLSWFSSEHCAAQNLDHFITIMHAFLDIASSHNEELMDEDIWVIHFSRVLGAVVDQTLPQSVRSMGSECISLMARLMPSRAASFISTVIRTVQAFSVSNVYPSMLSVGRRLNTYLPRQSEGLIVELVNHGIQWATRFFTEDEDPDYDTVIDDLATLTLSASGIKAHLTETVLGVAIQHRLHHVSAINLVTALLSRVHLKPVVVNRHLQSILQHVGFFKYVGNVSTDGASSREAIVRLLHTLFFLHPINTCQVTHVEPLVKIYRGTLSKADGQILSIFRLFEIERKISIASLLCRWSPTPNILSSTALEAVHGLDAILVLRTCLSFPAWRNLEDLSTEKATCHEAQLYDPVFLILLFAQMLAENTPESAFAWVEVFRTNIVSLLIKVLSSRYGTMRDIALCQLAGLWQYLESADLQERPHVLHILTLLKDTLPAPADEPPRRLPSYTTLLLLHSLRGIFYPSNFIYPITARFLLQRPELDTNDVPMLYNMLYSSTDGWKKERGWIIRFLSDGMMSSDDWRVLKGRHTWDLLASLFQSSEDDRALCTGILEVLANLSCNSQASMSLVLKSGLLSWIEIQLVTLKEGNTVEWIKILCNLMTVVDSGKLEASTGGEWRKMICRCLLILVENPKSSSTAAVLPHAVQAALQLSLLPGPQLVDLPLLIRRLTGCVRGLETSATVPLASIKVMAKQPSYHLYRSHEIHESLPTDDLLQIWGTSIEALWRISMTLDVATDSWATITSRMLVWRSVIGVNDGLCEWTRKEVVGNLAIEH